MPSPPVSAFRGHPQRLFLLASAALLLGLYWHVLGAPFLYDDLDQIVHNGGLASWTGFEHRFLLRPITLSTALLAYPGTIYRPVFWLSLFLDHRIWGLSPAGFHIVNLALHLANANLAFALFRRLRSPNLPAAGASLLWLALPVDTEVVAWVSARAYELCLLFLLVSLLAALQFLRQQRPSWLVVLCAAAFAAMLSHELGLVAVPALLALTLALQRARLRLALLPLAAVLLAWALALGLRWRIGVHTVSGYATPFWAAAALRSYLAFTFFPLHLSVERSTTLSAAHLSRWALLVPLALLLAVVVAFRHRRRTPLPFFGLVWFTLSIAPFAMLMSYQGVAERFGYLASLGLVLAIVSLAAAMPISAARSALLAFVAAWSGWSLLRTELRAGNWADPVALYTTSLVATPGSAALHDNLAAALQAEGRPAAAIAEFTRVLEINPRQPHAYASLGDVYLSQGDYAAAEANYGKALTQSPRDAAVLLNSGVAFADAGDLAAAEATFGRLLAVDPASSAAHVNLGVLYSRQSRTEDAMHQFAMAIDLKTKDPTPYFDLAVILQQAGRGDLALVLYKEVLELRPGDRDTLRNMELIQAGR